MRLFLFLVLLSKFYMSLLLPTVSGPSPTANQQLATQIAAALCAAGFIAVADQDDATTLLATGHAKAGDWRRLLENGLSATLTPTTTNHAPAHHAA
jgi:hypothetical protein